MTGVGDSVSVCSHPVNADRVGTDGNGIAYSGHSAAFDFKGEKILNLGEKEDYGVVSFSAQKLEEYRTKFPAWRDSDGFQLL